MAKSKTKRKHVRPVEQMSIGEKRFKRLAEPAKQVSLRVVHPRIVCADLRKGVLSSLARYLAQEQGIPDRAVAIELRKLISGSAQRTPYRLLVIEHPDGTRNQGGRPPGKDENTLAHYRNIVASYEESLAIERKPYLAREAVAKTFECDEATVKRAIRSVRDARKRESDEIQRAETEARKTSEARLRRETALDALRDTNKRG